MKILPAIDLKDGKCVRLYKGDFATTHQVAEDPVTVAQAFRDAGAKWIHMVDLDGALNGVRKNGDIVRAVAETSGLKVELGGGIRCMADLEAAEQLGVYRFVIGSAAVSDHDFVKEAVQKYGPRVAVGIDAKDGFVRTHGWTANSGISSIEFAKLMEGFGVQTIIFTDIDTDGTLAGPPLEKLKALRAAVNCEIVASGGVTNIDDIRNLKDLGADSAIIGKAYYAGTIDLVQAVREAGEQC